MEALVAPQIIVREATHPDLLELLSAISAGGCQDRVGLGYWLRKQKMRIVVTLQRYDTAGEMSFYDETSPNCDMLVDAIVQFASVDEADRFVAQWS